MHRLIALAPLALLAACGSDTCPEGQKKNLDGLCVDDPYANVESDTDADTDADTDTDDAGDDTAAVTVYDAIGGEAAVAAVVDAFIGQVAADPTVNWMFATTDLTRFATLLNEQICAAAGGPCTYTGRSMVETHAGMGVTDAQFDAVVADLLAALDTLGVPYSAGLDGSEPIDPLLAQLVAMRTDIVTDPAGDTVLFNQLGGHAGVTAVVEGMVAHVAADPRVNGRFADTDLPAFTALLVEQVCAATGGYCTYTGRSMVEAHTGMGITDDEFTAVVEDFATSLDELGIAHAPDFSGTLPADQLGQALAAMHDDIVGR